jgi:hypothetical protein
MIRGGSLGFRITSEHVYLGHDAITHLLERWISRPHVFGGRGARQPIFDAIEHETALFCHERNFHKVRSVDPGYPATDRHEHRGTQTVAEGAVQIVSQTLP